MSVGHRPLPKVFTAFAEKPVGSVSVHSALPGSPLSSAFSVTDSCAPADEGVSMEANPTPIETSS